MGSKKSNSSTKSLSYSQCLHSKTVDDDIEGSCVCLECGLVLEPLFLHNFIPAKCSLDFCEIRAFLTDVCANAAMPEYIISYTYQYFKSLSNDYAIKEKKFNKKAIAAYALYETLCRHKIPRTIAEIEYFTGVTSNVIWNIETSLTISETLSYPQDFVERFCTLLKIKFCHTKIIKRIVGNMSGMGNIRPKCVVAAVIYMYCKQKNLKMSMKKICEVCFVSTGNMYKIIKNLRVDFMKNVSTIQ